MPLKSITFSTEATQPVAGANVLWRDTSGQLKISADTLVTSGGGGGVVQVTSGGTGVATLGAGNFLEGNGTGNVISTKVVPTGAVVGTTDTQTLTNKTLDATNNTITQTIEQHSNWLAGYDPTPYNNLTATTYFKGTEITSAVGLPPTITPNGTMTAGTNLNFITAQDANGRKYIKGPKNTDNIFNFSSTANYTVGTTGMTMYLIISGIESDKVSGGDVIMKFLRGVGVSNVTLHTYQAWSPIEHSPNSIWNQPANSYPASKVANTLPAPEVWRVYAWRYNHLTDDMRFYDTIKTAPTLTTNLGSWLNTASELFKFQIGSNTASLGAGISIHSIFLYNSLLDDTTFNSTFDILTDYINASGVVSGKFALYNAPNWSRGDILFTDLTGTLGVTKGGTGVTSLTAGKFLEGNGTGNVISTKTIPAGNIVDDSTAQTLTNKTLTSPIISTVSNTGTLTLPTTTDTLVGRATIDTLTNKTLTAPVISTISNSGTVTLPTGTRTLVARDTVDTLTNKTLDATTNTIIQNIEQHSNYLATDPYVTLTSDAYFKNIELSSAVTTPPVIALNGTMTLLGSANVLTYADTFGRKYVKANKNTQNYMTLKSTNNYTIGTSGMTMFCVVSGIVSDRTTGTELIFQFYQGNISTKALITAQNWASPIAHAPNYILNIPATGYPASSVLNTLPANEVWRIYAWRYDHVTKLMRFYDNNKLVPTLTTDTTGWANTASQLFEFTFGSFSISNGVGFSLQSCMLYASELTDGNFGSTWDILTNYMNNVPVPGNMLKYVSPNWGLGELGLTELQDCTITAPVINQRLQYDGNLWVNFSKTYGEQFWNGNALGTVCTVQNTWYLVAGVHTASYKTADLTFTDNKIQYTGTGTKLFNLQYSCGIQSADNNRTMELAIFKNEPSFPTATPTGTLLQCTLREQQTFSAQNHTVSATCIVQLAQNDYVQLANRCTSDPNKTMIMRSLTFLISEI